jgi:hypothetical protein
MSLLEPVLGTELLGLAGIPDRQFVGGESKFTGVWVEHPNKPGFYSYIDTSTRTCYFRIGEAIYKTPLIAGGYEPVRQEVYRLYDLQG